VTPRRRAVVGLAVALALWPRAAVAQQVAQVALVIGSTLDTASTVYVLTVNPRTREANPLLAHGGSAGFVAGKTAATATLVWAIGKLAPTRPRLAKVIGYAGGAALAGLAVHNVRLGRP
jgi:hypothetical protein